MWPRLALQKNSVGEALRKNMSKNPKQERESPSKNVNKGSELAVQGHSLPGGQARPRCDEWVYVKSSTDLPVSQDTASAETMSGGTMHH